MNYLSPCRQSIISIIPQEPRPMVFEHADVKDCGGMMEETLMKYLIEGNYGRNKLMK